MKNHKLYSLIYLNVHYLLGLTLVFPSIVKILGKRFTQDASHYPIDYFQHFFEVLYIAQPYWQFLGVFQFFAGFCLLTGYFIRLGYVIGFTFFLNITFITLSYSGFAFTPVIAIVILLTLFIVIEGNILPFFINKNITLFPNFKLKFNTYDSILGIAMGLIAIPFGVTKDRPDILFYIITTVLFLNFIKKYFEKE